MADALLKPPELHTSKSQLNALDAIFAGAQVVKCRKEDLVRAHCVSPLVRVSTPAARDDADFFQAVDSSLHLPTALSLSLTHSLTLSLSHTHTHTPKLLSPPRPHHPTPRRRRL